MISHAPEGYDCPFCVFVTGGPEERTWNRESDLVVQDDHVTGFVSPEWWPNNPGHVIIIPNEHHESLYTLPLDLATRIHATSRDVAIAMKSEHATRLRDRLRSGA